MQERGRTRRHRGVWLAGTIAAASLTVPLAAAGATAPPPELKSFVTPIDKQRWENPDHMRWPDYRAVPATAWADVDRAPKIRRFKVALVLGDFTDQPFLVTQDPRSHPFGTPLPKASNLPRSQVAQYYEDFLTVPSDLNHGHTVNEYWMEDTYGEYGVDLTAFGVYGMPGKMHEYGLNDVGQLGEGCPSGDSCDKDIRGDLGQAWLDDVGQGVVDKFELVYFLTAGHDESGTWQEFGEMKFASMDEVPDEFGPPDPDLPNWIRTRYVPWTSWLAGSNQWPNAGGGSSTQSESSGSAVYAHELSHLFGIGDNYNNPYGVPLSRSYSGPWDMMSRGTFNGPRGPHQRWVVPATRGGAMGSLHMFRNKLKLDVLSDDQFVELSRDGLEQSGVVLAEITARAVPVGAEFDRPGLIGVNVEMEGGDLSPPCDIEEDYQCDRGNYDNYTIEVVDRMGSDSFTPGSGVLLAKTKNVDAAPFIWIIDANPQDIDLLDFVRPDGTDAMVSLGDYRQLADALFKAGTDSGSEYEYVDEPNRLHFYVLDLSRDADGILRYVVAVRSLDGSGPHDRSVDLDDGVATVVQPGVAVRCTFRLTNTGATADLRTVDGAPEGAVDGDVFRLTAQASNGWRVWLPREVAGVSNGDTVDVEVYAGRSRGGGTGTTVSLQATSESDRAATAAADCSS